MPTGRKVAEVSSSENTSHSGIREVQPVDVPVSLAEDKNSDNSDRSNEEDDLLDGDENGDYFEGEKDLESSRKKNGKSSTNFILSDVSEADEDKNSSSESFEYNLASKIEKEKKKKISTNKIEFHQLVSEDEILNDHISENGNIDQNENEKVPYHGHLASNASIARANDIFGVTDSESEQDLEESEDYNDIDPDFVVPDSDDENAPKNKIKSKSDEFAKPSQKPIAKEIPLVSIKEKFSNEELEKNFATTRQQIIALKDIPERFLTRSIPVQVPESSSELENEAYWIFNNFFKYEPISSAVDNKRVHEEAVVLKIRNTLDLIRNQFLDIPFIAYYRTEFVAPELNVRDIWSIYDQDAKWCDLQNKKKFLANVCSLIQSHQYDLMSCISKEANDSDILKFQPLSQALIKSIENLSTFEEAETYSNYLMFYYGHIIKNQGNSLKKNGSSNNSDVNADSSYKAPIFKTFYSICEENNLTQLVRYFGITPSNLAENIAESFAVNEIDQATQELSNVALEYINDKFPSVEKIVECLVNLVAMEIGVEPKIVDHIRKLFRKNGLITVVPTKRGLVEIDESHPCYNLKYIYEKPLKSFKNTEYFQLHVAEKNELVKLNISFESQEVESSESGVFKQILNFYQKDEYSRVARSWNSLREQALSIAINQILIPKLSFETKQLMFEESQEALINTFSRKIGNIINRAPFFIGNKFNWHQNQENMSIISKSTSNNVTNNDDLWSSSMANENASVAPTVDARSTQSSKAGTEMDSVVAPSQLLQRMDSSHKIFSFTYSMENFSKAALVSVLNVDGTLLDYLVLPNFQYTRNSAQAKIQQKAEDIKKLKEFIKQYEPKAIVIAANSRKANNFYKELEVILQRLSEEVDYTKEISLHFSDIRIAKLYQNSLISENEFPKLPQMVKFAVSIGRYFIDPLFELCRLFDPSDLQCPLMYLILDPLQREVSPKILHSLIDKMLVTKANQLGVSIMKLNSHNHKKDLLKFVCGLGPCKQAMIYKKIDMAIGSGKKIYSRADLINELNLGPYIFANCSGFLKFYNSNPRRARKKPHLLSFYLDTTRVHPESYHWALKLAQDSLCIQDSELADADDIFKKIEENPSKVQDLDIGRYVEDIEMHGFGNKRETLTNMKYELKNPFQDNRPEFCASNPDEIFEMFNHDCLQMLQIGKIVIAKIIGFKYKRLNDVEKQTVNPLHDETNQVWMCGFCKESDFSDFDKVCVHVEHNQCQGKMIGLRVMIDDQVPGFVPIEYISDQYDLPQDELASINPKEKVKLHMVVHCRILSFNPKFQELVLSCRSSDLQNLNGNFTTENDEYHSDVHKENIEKRLNPQNNEQDINSILPRTIIHPKFRNTDFNGAQKILEDKPIGEFIFRPCRGKTDYLTLTWKVAMPNIVANLLVEEKIKKNAASLGEVLIVENFHEKFDDLDEIAATVCHKLGEMAIELNEHQYFNNEISQVEDVEKYLEDKKAAQPARVPYVFTTRQSVPGKIMLSYYPNKIINHEYINLTPRGFRFRSRYFNYLSQLVNWFKENFNNPKTIKSTPSTPQEVPDAVSVASSMTMPSNNGTIFDNKSSTDNTTQVTPNITPFAMSGIGNKNITPGFPPTTITQDFVTPQGTTYNTSMDLSLGTHGVLTPFEFAQHLSRSNLNVSKFNETTPGSFGNTTNSSLSLTPQELYNQALYSQFQNNQLSQMMSGTPNSMNPIPYFDINSLANLSMAQHQNTTPNFGMMNNPTRTPFSSQGGNSNTGGTQN